jgi:hypothetical protein
LRLISLSIFGFAGFSEVGRTAGPLALPRSAAAGGMTKG